MNAIFKENTSTRMNQIVIHNNNVCLQGQVDNKESEDVSLQTQRYWKKQKNF